MRQTVRRELTKEGNRSHRGLKVTEEDGDPIEEEVNVLSNQKEVIKDFITIICFSIQGWKREIRSVRNTRIRIFVFY